MADRGFTISESVGLYQAQLAIPAFTRGKNQLDPVDVERTWGIANVRIHVERVIGLLRQKYTILQSTLPLDYLTCSNNTANCPLIERMNQVCSALTNLCPSVVPFEKAFSIHTLCKKFWASGLCKLGQKVSPIPLNPPLPSPPKRPTNENETDVHVFQATQK